MQKSCKKDDRWKETRRRLSDMFLFFSSDLKVYS